jgi:hypothetical protein
MDKQRPNQLEQMLKPDVPRLLCLDDCFATAGQRTLDEGIRSGTTSEILKKFARDYIAQHKNSKS